MSAALAPALEVAPRRIFPRHPISVPVDLIVLRSGVPENLPGRCTDISEAGIGAVVAGEMSAGQQVAVELRLPDVGLPVRARARVRYQTRLRCGLEFVGLSVEQREMIRYWVYRSAAAPLTLKGMTLNGTVLKGMDLKGMELPEEIQASAEVPVADAAVDASVAAAPKRRIRMGRRGFYLVLLCMVALGALAWWQWQRSWSELETHAQAAEPRMRGSGDTQSSFDGQVPFETEVPFETMEKRLLTKVEPVYPEAARAAGIEGLVVLDAEIAADGSVQRLQATSGRAELVESAITAVRGWKFEPYLYDGKPVAVETSIAVEFRLK